MGALLVLPTMAVLALGAVAAADDVAHARQVGEGARLAAVLPDALRLADRLRVESGTISSGEAGTDTARLGRLRMTTDAQVAAWLGELGSVSGDPELQPELRRLGTGLANLDTVRADLGDPARATSAMAGYAALIGTLAELGGHLTSQREEELARHSQSLDDVGVAVTALLAERAALLAALAPGTERPALATVTSLAGAQTAWSEAFDRFRAASSTGVALKAAAVEKAGTALAPAVDQILTTGATTGLRRTQVMTQWGSLFAALTATAADAADELHTALAARSSVVRIQTEITIAAAAGTVAITAVGVHLAMRRRRRRAEEESAVVLAERSGRPDELLDTFLAHTSGSHVGEPEPPVGVVPIPSPRHVPRHAAPVSEPA